MISSATRANQCSKILGLLIAARGSWVSLLDIKECGAQYNARIYELRRLGFGIENRIGETDGVRRSWFRLTSTPSPVNESQSNSAAPAKEISFPQFGDLAPRSGYPD
jgi:hypothetical protein